MPLIIDRNVETNTLSESAALLENSSERIELAFRALAQRNMIAISNRVFEALAEEIEYVKENRPELNELEAMRAARMLLLQRLRCYLGALEQIS